MDEPQAAPAEARDEHLELSEQIEEARWRYYVLDDPTLSDADFEAVNKVAEGRHTRFVNMKDTFGYDVW